MDTCFNYCGETAYFSSDEKKWIFRIYKLKKKYPDSIEIIKEPKENNGCIYCRMPSEWLKLGPKLTKNLTEEQRQKMSERLRLINAQKNNAK